MTLLMATALEANNQIVLFSFALSLVNQQYGGHGFSSIFQTPMSVQVWINRADCKYVFISDRDKRLEVGLTAVLPGAFYAMCDFHLNLNVKKHLRGKPASYVLRLAEARTEERFALLMTKLRKISPATAVCLEATDVSQWARHACSYPRFRQTTSNMAESLIDTFKGLRSVPPLRLIEGIWQRIMAQIFWRFNSLQPGILANEPTKAYEGKLEQGLPYQIRQSENDIYQIEGLKGNTFVVNLRDEETVCTCRTYKEYRLL